MTSEPGQLQQRAMIKYISTMDLVHGSAYVLRIPNKVGEQVGTWDQVRGCFWVAGVVDSYVVPHPDDHRGANVAYPIREYIDGETLEIT